MANAISAYKEAFSSYSRNVADFVIYSMLVSVSGSVVALASGAVIAVLAMMFIGSAASLLVISNGVPLDALGIVAMLGIFALLSLGSLIFLWLLNGLQGAYLDALNAMLSGRKPSMPGFFGSVSRRATPMLLASIFVSVVVAIPMAAAAIVAFLFNGIFLLSAGLLLLGLLAGTIIGFFLIFTVPGIIIDNRTVLGAMKSSVAISGRNLPGVLIYVAISFVLLVPALIPVVNVLYFPLIYLPVSQAALLLLYKGAK